MKQINQNPQTNLIIVHSSPRVLILLVTNPLAQLSRAKGVKVGGNVMTIVSCNLQVALVFIHGTFATNPSFSILQVLPLC